MCYRGEMSFDIDNKEYILSLQFGVAIWNSLERLLEKNIDKKII